MRDYLAKAAVSPVYPELGVFRAGFAEALFGTPEKPITSS